MTENPYQPTLAKIEKIKVEVTGERAIKTFRLVMQDKNVQEEFSFVPGQCIMLSSLGKGESMFAISSSPTEKDYLEVSVMKQGKNTSALHETEEGDTVGVRGSIA
jgi:NAD(P)H-flavin reductase